MGWLDGLCILFHIGSQGRNRSGLPTWDLFSIALSDKTIVTLGQMPPDAVDQCVPVVRLEDESRGAGGHRARRPFRLFQPGQDQDRRVAVFRDGAQGARHLEAIHLRQQAVDQQQVGARAGAAEGNAVLPALSPAGRSS